MLSGNALRKAAGQLFCKYWVDRIRKLGRLDPTTGNWTIVISDESLTEYERLSSQS